MIGQIIAETPYEIARLGKFTASKIDALFTEPRSKEAKEKGELSDTAKTYILERAAEIITGTIRKVETPAMEWGNLYEKECAEMILQVYPQIEYYGRENPRYYKYSEFSGGSPDGVGPKMVLEIKCPENPANHVEYALLESAEDLKKSERDYYHQIQFNMLCVAKEQEVNVMEMIAVFASYSPIVNEPFPKLKLLTIYPDADFFAKITTVIPRAEDYLADVVYKLTQPTTFSLATKGNGATIIEPAKP